MEVLLQTVLSGLTDASLYMMLSVGLTLLFGVMGVVNFAQGDFMTVSAYLAYGFIAVLALNPVLAIALSVPALCLLGLLFYLGVLQPTEGYKSESRVLATFGVALLIQGVIDRIWTATPIAVSQSTSVVSIASLPFAVSKLIDISLAALSVVLLTVVLERTRLGRQVRAASQDPEGAELIGIDTRRIRAITTIIATAFTGVGGYMLLTTSYLYPQLGFNLILTGFAVVILAGLGSVTGAVVASIALGLANEGVATYLNTAYAGVVPFVIIVAVLLIRPKGIAGRTVRYGDNDGGL